MAEPTFNAKLLAAMQEMSNPKKDTNAYKYKYAQLDQVLDIVRPALQAHGMDIRWQQTQVSTAYLDPKDGEIKERTIFVQNLYVFDANEERLMDSRPIDFTAPIQDRGKEETYLRRYALQSVFALAAEDDDGAEINAKQKAKKSAQSAKNGARTENEPKSEQVPEEDAESIDRQIVQGIEALHKLTGMNKDAIEATMKSAKLDTPRTRLEWLRKTYKENLELQAKEQEQ